MTENYPIIKGLDQKIRAFVGTDAFREELLQILNEDQTEYLINAAPTYIKSNEQGCIDEKMVEDFIRSTFIWLPDDAVSNLLGSGEKNKDVLSEAYQNVAKFEEPVVQLFLKHYKASL